LTYTSEYDIFFVSERKKSQLRLLETTQLKYHILHPRVRKIFKQQRRMLINKLCRLKRD